MPYDAGYKRRGYRRSAWGGNNRITTPSAVRLPRQCPAARVRKGIVIRMESEPIQSRYVRSGSWATWPPRHARTNILPRR